MTSLSRTITASKYLHRQCLFKTFMQSFGTIPSLDFKINILKSMRFMHCSVAALQDSVVRGTIPPNGNGVAVGQFAEMDRIFDEANVHQFACLVGDKNPLHQQWHLNNLPHALVHNPMVEVDNEDISDSGRSTKVLVHGMLVSSLFTAIFGTLIPGAVYLKQSLDFVKPVHVNCAITGKITIERLRQWQGKGLILMCDTCVFAHNDPQAVKVRGKASVWLPSGTALNQ